MPYYNQTGGSFWQRIPVATRNLLLINVLVYILSLIDVHFRSGITYQIFPVYFVLSPSFRPWQVITYMFMHDPYSIAHIFCNMWGLMVFGIFMEQQIGTKKYLILYFSSGIGAWLLNLGVQFFNALVLGKTAGLGVPMLGASGAIYGLQVAFAVLVPDMKLTLLFPPITLKAKWMILIFIGIELVAGISGTLEGIAHFAHLGGALVGFLLMLFWKKRSRW